MKHFTFKFQKLSILVVLMLTVSIFNLHGQPPGGGPVPPSITTSTVSPLSYCSGDSIFISYIDSGAYTSTNVFTAQLSDPIGDFSSPINLGTSIIQMGGTIAGVIPGVITPGTAYRVRVVSSEPYCEGYPNNDDLTIKNTVNVSFTGSIPDQCQNLTILNLLNYVTVSPIGGTFSGPGVSGTNFSAFDAGYVGSPHTITYTYSDGISCDNSATNQVVILEFPPVLITNLDTVYCSNFHSVSLIGQPAGGTFSGTGIVNVNLFSPAIAGVGQHVISYDYSASNGCSDTYTQTVSVQLCDNINDHNINEISVYPSPNNGVFYIKNNNAENNNLKIYSAYGQLVLADYINKNETKLVDISSVAASGLYFVKIGEKTSIIEIKK